MAYGMLDDVAIGTMFPNRRALFDASVHRDIRRGITGRRSERGAESIVLSQGYEDDLDLGDLIFYTGNGGRDSESGRQIANQSMTDRNLTLATNVENGQPVRVVRSVENSYRYDGLYVVEEAWLSPGRSGFLVCRFRLKRLGDGAPTESEQSVQRAPVRREVTLYRLVRDSAAATRVKSLHDFRCQVCGTRIETAAGYYAEAAHIVPLGRGYDGPDDADNLLCLCPNDHVRFDYGGLFILDDMIVVDREGSPVGRLKTVEGHTLDVQHVRAHRRIFGRS